MLKRLFLFLLISAVIISILGYKCLSWRPEIIASITGKNFLLNTPLSSIVDVEKLYIIPEDHMDIAVLKLEVEQARSAAIHPVIKDRTLDELSHRIGLLTGKFEVRSIEDAKMLFRTESATYTKLSSGHSELNMFFYWEGPFGFVADDYYFIAYKKPDLSEVSVEKTIDIDGFSFHQVRKWFTDPNIQPGTIVCIVGRYAGKAELRLANGQKTIIPLLVDCYIDKKIK